MTARHFVILAPLLCALCGLTKAAETKPNFIIIMVDDMGHAGVSCFGDPIQRTTSEWQRWQAGSEQERLDKFRGMTLPVDEGLGQIRAALEKHGIAKSTVILFFTDNGPTPEAPSGNPKWRGNKGSVYEGGHKVPFIAWWPGKIAAGSESSAPAITLDIMPTLLALAGVKPGTERPPDGVDLSGLLLADKAPPARPLFWAALGNNGARQEAMRDGPWKLVVNHPKAKPGSFANEQVELYRLDQDPGEKSDLAKSEPAQTAAMLTRLKAWYADTQRDATPQPGGWPQ